MHGAGEEDQPARRAAAVPPDDHLVALLRGGSRAGEGGYNAVDAWWTALRDDGGSDATADRLVTVHEAFHATLNDCTGFGIGLAATGVLARFRGNDTAVRRLVNMCRTVHEAYATFTRLWAVSAGDLALLGDRADYLGWYRDAADLLPLPAGSPARAARPRRGGPGVHAVRGTSGSPGDRIGCTPARSGACRPARRALRVAARVR